LLAIVNHGQICFGTERILVHKNVVDAFRVELAHALRSSPPVGNAVTSDGAERAHKLIADAISDGAELVAGKNELTGRASLQPSVLTNINPKSRINKEEIWGPSATLCTFNTDEEAIQIANNTDYGLSASIFTKDYARALKMARDLDFGQVQVNALTFHVSSTAPVTGFKGSGWGSNGGGYGVEEFMFNKHVCLCP
jgi:acyl-CoA reductase-like NAD-dependent aldehyde dehydrogenase